MTINDYPCSEDVKRLNPDVFLNGTSPMKKANKITSAVFVDQPSKHRKPPTESEDSLLRYIIHIAHLYGWMVAHFRPAMTQSGQWVTAVAGDGAGFPDLVLVHPLFRGALFVECKSQKGKLSPAQEHWREWLEKAGCEYRLWRPADRPEIEKTLRIE